MSDELEPTENVPVVMVPPVPARRGTVAPAPKMTSKSSNADLTLRPEWTDMSPPYREESDVEMYWSRFTTPLRALALSFLWVTYTWYRFAAFATALGLTYFVFIIR